MNIIHYNPIYYVPSNTIVLTDDEYRRLQEEYKKKQKYIEEENYKKMLEIQRLDKIKQKYLYGQKIIENSINTNIIVDENNKVLCIVKNELYQNYYYEPFEAFIPDRESCVMIYPRNSFTKMDIQMCIKKESYEDLCAGKMKCVNLLLQLFIPLLPKYIVHNKYDLSNYDKKHKSEMNNLTYQLQDVNRFLRRIQKVCSYTVFGGISLQYFMNKYIIDDSIKDSLYFKSNDYDLNVTYKKTYKDEKYDDFLFLNYIVYMIHRLNITYYKTIVDEKVELNVNDEKCGYINMFMTFSNKDDMNRYIWLINMTKVYKLDSYTTNIGHYGVENHEVPYIYKCVFKSEELHTLFILKYVQNSITDVKAIIKIETHKNQIFSIEERINKEYTPFDFIFRHSIDIEYSYFDSVHKIHYNDPIFLTLVYIDLIQKYKRKCESVLRRLHKSHKDRKRYICIVKNILIPFLIEKYQSDYLLCKMCKILLYNEDGKYMNILVKKLLKFKTTQNIYLQMEQFNDFILQKVDQICTKYCKNHLIVLNTVPYYYINVCGKKIDVFKKKYVIENENKRKDEDYEVYIEKDMYYRIIDYLRQLYFMKDFEYNISYLYDEKLSKKLASISLSSIRTFINHHCNISKLEKTKNQILMIRNEYKRLYEKMMEVEYKNEDLDDKIKYICEKMKYINDYVDKMDKKISECENMNLLKKNLERVIQKKLNMIYKEKEQKKQAFEKEKRKIEELEKQKIELEKLRLLEEKKVEELKRQEEDRILRLQREEEKRRLKEERRKIEESRLLWKRRKEKFYETLYYVPNKSKNYAISLYTNGSNVLYYMYENISFMTILKICGFMLMLGIIGYGKYIQYQEDITKKMLEESQIRYKDGVRYKNHYDRKYFNKKGYYDENEMYKSRFQRKHF